MNYFNQKYKRLLIASNVKVGDKWHSEMLSLKIESAKHLLFLPDRHSHSV